MADGLLAGKLALVTGGASGIGHAAALALAEIGADVIIVDRVPPTVGEHAGAAAKLGFRHADLSMLEAIPGWVDAIHREVRGIDILVNCAGIIDRGNSVLTNALPLWRDVLAVNLEAPMILMQSVAANMISRKVEGRIVNVTSSSAFRAALTTPAYACSKAALTQLTRTVAAELGPFGITANCVAPGVTRTEMAMRTMQSGTRLEDAAKQGPLANLTGRVSEPGDVAVAIRFLCLPESRQITGQTIHTSAGAVV